MRKIVITTISMSFFLVQLIVPTVAIAEVPGQLPPNSSGNFLNLVPCGQSSDPNVATDCGLDDFVIMIRNIINAMIVLAIPVTMIVLTWVGVVLLTAAGDSGKINRAKATLWKVVVGFLIILTAWLVVQVIFLAITGVNFNTFFKRK